MTTKIQPTNIDATLDYSVHKLTVSGVDVLGYAQSAFLQANTVYNAANTLSPTDEFARTQANAAFAQANTGAIANTFVQVGFPIGDYGLVTQPNYGGLGQEQLVTIWDNRVTVPTHLIFSNNTIILDTGYIS
jgi:hypothetical protein